MLETISFNSSPLLIPEHFHAVPYKTDCFPGSDKSRGIEQGANCQYFAYELIRYYGCVIPDFRSSDLWEDAAHTSIVTHLQPLDLVLLHKTQNAWGAHVGVYVGNNFIIHLSKNIGFPIIQNLESVMQQPQYCCFIGAKRCLLQQQ